MRGSALEALTPAGMEASATLILLIAAFLTAILSAIVGMAGGITLLSVMLLDLEPLVAIPLHGAVQLVSNGSRAWIQRKHVDWAIVSRFAVLLLPAGFIGYYAIAELMPATVTKAAIGVFVLVATWRPGWLLFGSHPEDTDASRRFLVLGGVSGLLNVAIGATGPLLAPFFLNLGLTRFALIGTKAFCQMLGHLAKIAIFGVVGFSFGSYLPLLLGLWAMVVVGTWTGSQLLNRVDEVAFTWLYKGVLTLIALRLIFVALETSA
jgi:uncharacterized membrane protein YfcA